MNSSEMTARYVLTDEERAKEKEALPYVIKVLEGAQECIEKGWCQGFYAIDDQNEEVWPTQGNAIAFCPMGGILRGEHLMGEATSMEERYHHQFVRNLCHRVFRTVIDKDSIDDWNDDPDRCEEEVIGAFDDSIAFAQRRLERLTQEEAQCKLEL